MRKDHEDPIPVLREGEGEGEVHSRLNGGEYWNHERWNQRERE